MDRSEAVNALTAELVESRLRSTALFTTLDISNGLKQRLFPVRHGEVARAVRSLYESGALARFGYERALIDVNTDSGATLTQAYVYLPKTAHPDDYGCRIQDALPPVAGDIARDLLACAPTVTPTLLAAAPGTRRTFGPRRAVRRDGALPIPRRRVQQTQWRIGDRVEVSVVPSPDGGASVLVLTPLSASPASGSVTVSARVWSGYRVRVCRTALRRLGVDSISLLPLPAAVWNVQGNVLEAVLSKKPAV